MYQSFTHDALRVLIIEDDHEDAKLVSRFLQQNPTHAVKLEIAESIEQAVQLLPNRDFDVAVLDMDLPDGHGIDSLHKIQAVDARLPVVVLTGHDDECLSFQAIQSGAQDFLCKNHLSGGLLLRALVFAVARQQKYLGLEAVADMDPLTGLNNRRFLYKEFPALQRQTELGQSLSMALLDIDYFKSINDLHGHLAGDAVLRQVASELSRAMADLGHVVRFGGEEFAIVLTSCPLPEAKEVCSALLSHLASISFSIGRKQSIHITASIGATCVWPTDSFESALSRADAALYAAKRAGRDRVSTQGPCMEQLAHRQ